MYRKLKIRLTLMYVSIISIILLGMSVSAFFLAKSQLSQNMQSSFEGKANTILKYIKAQFIIDHTWLSQSESEGDWLIHVESGGYSMKYCGVMDAQRRRTLVSMAKNAVFVKYGFDIETATASALNIEQISFNFLDENSQKQYALAARIPKERGTCGVLIIQSTQQDENQLKLMLGGFLGFTLLAILLLLLFSWKFIDRTLQPIVESQRRQNDFISSASHELRSPLAVISASLSSIKGAPPKQAEIFIDSAISETQRMARLIGDLLLLAGSDSHSWRLQKEKVEMETLLLESFEKYEQIAKTRNIKLSVCLPENILPRCYCDPQRIEQVLAIIIDNAFGYVKTDGSGKIKLSIDERYQKIQITIADNGSGIENSEKEKIFRRFYRSDTSRNDREHFGLGLCIAKEIILMHKGEIWVEDSEDGGAAFVILIPVL